MTSYVARRGGQTHVKLESLPKAAGSPESQNHRSAGQVRAGKCWLVQERTRESESDEIAHLEQFIQSHDR